MGLSIYRDVYNAVTFSPVSLCTPALTLANPPMYEYQECSILYCVVLAGLHMHHVGYTAGVMPRHSYNSK